MSHLDTAAGITECPASTCRATHFVGAIGGSMTVIDTSVGLAPGDQTHGPVRAQLLVVCESTGEHDAEQRLNAMAIDSVMRELLREDAWMLALGPNNGGPLAGTLTAAVNAALGNLAAVGPAGEADANEQSSDTPEVAITAALVAWPMVAVTSSGSGTVIHVAGNRATFPLPTDKEDEGNWQGSSSPTAHVWTAELAERDVLILGTSSVARSVAEAPATFAEEVASMQTAKLVVDRLLDNVGPFADAAVAVARLSNSVAGLLHSLTQQEVDPPTATPETISSLELLGTDNDPLVSEGPTL